MYIKQQLYMMGKFLIIQNVKFSSLSKMFEKQELHGFFEHTLQVFSQLKFILLSQHIEHCIVL